MNRGAAMSEHIPEAAVEAATAAYEATEVAAMGCTCCWDEHGNSPPDCRCAERNAEARRERARGVVAAALPHLVTEEAVERHAQDLYTIHAGVHRWMEPWGRLTGAHKPRWREKAAASLRAALGIQDEQEGPDG
jgi:hypothetical protein